MQKSEEFISAADYTRLRRLVYEVAGIALGPARKTMLEGRIRRRLKELSISSYRDYCRYLFSDSGHREELVHLIDVVTTNKTDFFREPKHFEFLATRMLPEHMRDSGGRRAVRFWSAGCSTGEEPYTLAIVLSEFQQTHPGFLFRILATDVSTTVLKKAELGVYAAEGIRPVAPALKVKYFMRGREPDANRVRVVPELRRLVEFSHLNFMDSNYGINEKLDAIFCRNVIIYFDKPTQQHILEKLTECLLPGGYLFMGHAETLHELDLPLVQVAPALYRRIDAGA
jgi:chemotaxis protein methyltransferase CheR